jgi:hypothetical protein
VRFILFLAALLGACGGLAVAQVAVLHIKVIEGEGAVNAAGARNARPLSVEVTDETGKPVESASVSFHLPDEGPGGTFGNGLRTDVTVTDSSGRANLHTMLLNRTPGRFAIRIVASKEQARAGIMSFQYISDGKVGGETKNGAVPANPTKSGASVKRSPLKWVVIAALAAGAATAGALIAGKSGSNATPASTPTAPVATITIGGPSLTVGKP